MGNCNCPGIHCPGKVAGYQQSGGSWVNFLTQLPGGPRRVMLTWTWSWPTRKSWSGCDHQCPPWLSRAGNSGVPDVKGRPAAEHRLVDSKGEDCDLLRGQIHVVPWEAALKGCCGLTRTRVKELRKADRPYRTASSKHKNDLSKYP